MLQPSQLTKYPWKKIRCSLGAILVSLVLTGTTTWSAFALDAPAPKPQHELIFHDQKLNARITTVPLRHVLDEVGRLTGVQIYWTNGGGAEPVSVEFRALPLSTALRRLLYGQNFMLFYRVGDGEDRLTQIWIPSKGGVQEQLSSSPTASLEAAPLPEEEATVEDLLQAAQQEEDPLSRVDVIEALGRYRDDPRVKPVLTHVAQGDQNPQVQEVATMLLEEME